MGFYSKFALRKSAKPFPPVDIVYFRWTTSADLDVCSRITRYNSPNHLRFWSATMNLFGLVAVIIIALYLINSIKILREYERGVIFRLGRMLPLPKGPGIILVFAPIDQMVRIDLRQIAFDVPTQDIITHDNVTLKVNAVIFLRVVDPRRAVVEVSNYQYQTQQFAQTTLRSVLGEVELDELLAHREKINLRLQSILDQHTGPWGVKVSNVEVKQVDLPETMTRAMAKQAEAEREKRSKIIHAEGEFAAAQRLVDAAALLASQPTKGSVGSFRTRASPRRRRTWLPRDRIQSGEGRTYGSVSVGTDGRQSMMSVSR
jgi:regulator of protease activity HflC (stomatin/prohibitin superfamily)